MMVSAASACPRVTAILQAVGLGPDFSRVPPATLEYARMRGRAVHAAIQYHAEGTLDEATLHPVVRPFVTAYLAFQREAEWTPLATELELVHPTWHFQGHPDAVGWLQGRRALVDWKSGDTVDLEAATLQLAAYRLLWTAARPSEPVADQVVVHLRDDATYRVYRVDAERETQTFLAALVVYHALDRQGRLTAHHEEVRP